MALTQNLLESTLGYSFCVVKIALNRGLKDTFLQEVALQSRKPDNDGSCSWFTELRSLVTKKAVTYTISSR